MLRYKTGACICNVIPQEADAVVQVQVRSLEQHFLNDIITHPKSYISSKKSSPDKQDSAAPPPSKPKVKLMDCISVPKSLLFYRIDKRWTSSDIEIKDHQKLKRYLERNNYESGAGDGIEFYSKKKQSLMVIGNKLRVSYGADASTPVTTGEEKRTCQAKGDKLFDAALNSKSDVAFVDNQGQFINLNFGQGIIDIDGQYHLAALQPSAKVSSSEGVGQLSVLLDVEKLLGSLNKEHKNKFANFTKLRLDSLAEHMSGAINAVLYDLAVTSDTIVTYDYDDNFNKVEVKKIKENLAPSYNLTMGMDAAGTTYMKEKNAIVEKDGQEVLAIMPLVTTYCREENETLFLYTETTDKEQQLVSSDSKFTMSLEVARFLDSAKDNPPSWHKYLEGISDIDFEVSNEDKIAGKVIFEDKRNAIVSLAK